MLPPKRKRFVDEYLVDLNGTQAAIRAGYSPHGAEVTACRLLRDAKIASLIDAAKKAQQKRTAITADFVLAGLKEVAERCMQRVPVMVRRGRDIVQKIDEETGEGVWEFDSAGANRALELLGKHLVLFTDKVEATGKDGAPLVPPSLRVEFVKASDAGHGSVPG